MTTDNQNSPVAPRARDLLGIVRTAQAEARRLINGEDSGSDLAQTKLDLPETLRVLEHALSQPAAVAGPVLDVRAIAAAVCQRVAELPDRNSPEDWPEAMLVTGPELIDVVSCEITQELAAAPQAPAAPVEFQQRVQPWLMECFGPVISADKQERNHRFLEEALETVQAAGCTASEAHQLVDYVFGRPVGELGQEVGGAMTTLAALCLANGIDMHAEAEKELARVWTMVEKIRAKQAAKPKQSPLPAAPAAPEVDAFTHAELLEIKRAVEEFADCNETDVDYALLLRAAQAGYLECTQFHVLNQSALDLDTVAAAQAKEGVAA